MSDTLYVLYACDNNYAQFKTWDIESYQEGVVIYVCNSRNPGTTL